MRQHKILNTSNFATTSKKDPSQEMLDNICQTFNPCHSNLNNDILFLLEMIDQIYVGLEFWEQWNGSYNFLIHFTVAQIYLIKREGGSQLWSNCWEPSEESSASIISGLMMYLPQQRKRVKITFGAFGPFMEHIFRLWGVGEGR